MSRIALIKDNSILSLHWPGQTVNFKDGNVPVSTLATHGWTYKTYRMATVAGPEDTGEAVMTAGVPTWKPAPPPPPPTGEELAAYAASVRYDREVGGFSWNGWPVATDDRSQGKIGNEVLATQTGTREDGEMWKFADGSFRPLTNAQIVALGTAALEHVKACFAVEGGLLMAIMGGTVTTFAQIDGADWPA